MFQHLRASLIEGTKSAPHSSILCTASKFTCKEKALQQLKIIGADKSKAYRVIFFNWDSPENVSRLAPPKFAWTGPPPKFSKCWNHIHFARHLDVFRSLGGASLGLLTIF